MKSPLRSRPSSSRVAVLAMTAILLGAAVPAFVAAETATTVPTDGYDRATGQTLVQEGKLGLVTTSNNSRFDVAAGGWLSVQFAPGVPSGATVTSAKVLVEHSEDWGTATGAMAWQVGQGALDNPNVAGDPLLKPSNLFFESTTTWDVSTSATTPALANNLKFVVRNNSTTGKRTHLDRIQLVVAYSTAPPPPPPPPPPNSVIVAAAGDVACDPADANFNGGSGTTTACRQKATSDLLVSGGFAAVLALGDLQYESGTAAAFNASYDPSWGRVKSITKPAAGNHEYQTAGASPYYAYFGAAAGDPAKGYYSYNLGAWHVIVLNSNCTIVACAVGSAQEQWLRADLAANPTACTMAYWHHPRFSSGSHGSDTATAAFWQALYEANADLILVGHEHDYERFAAQNPSAVADAARGIREFVVGTGGKSSGSFGTVRANSEARMTGTFGILKLTLRSDGYDWQFVPEAGRTFADTGSTACH